MDYPIWDVAMGGELLMALVAVTHVIVSHFAIGGGLLIVVAETLSVRRGDRELRELARRSSLVLILFSTVFGAISGVGIWVVAGLISPGAISALIHTYVWGWAMEWVFFILEIVAALIYYATWNKISKGAHLLVGWLYFVGAYGSLVIINGIVTFMLTPGRWLETRDFWDGFFNPTNWPSVVLRTGIALMMAAVFMVFPALKASAGARPRLLRFLGWWLVAGTLLAYGGYRWWETELLPASRSLFLGAAPLLEKLAATRTFTLWSMALTLALALVFLVGMPRLMRVVVAVVVALAAFSSFAGFERVREGVRKPFLIHGYMFSNGLLVERIPEINEKGILAVSGWAARIAGDDPVSVGRQIFRVECSACHTLDGYQSIRRALPTADDLAAVAAGGAGEEGERAFRAQCLSCHRDSSAAEMAESLPSPEEMKEDPEMIQDLLAGMVEGTLVNLKDMGEVYAEAGGSGPVDTRGLSHPYMPPFAGTDEELEALAAYLEMLGPPDTPDAGEGGR